MQITLFSQKGQSINILSQQPRATLSTSVYVVVNKSSASGLSSLGISLVKTPAAHTFGILRGLQVYLQTYSGRYGVRAAGLHTAYFSACNVSLCAALQGGVQLEGVFMCRPAQPSMDTAGLHVQPAASPKSISTAGLHSRAADTALLPVKNQVGQQGCTAGLHSRAAQQGSTPVLLSSAAVSQNQSRPQGCTAGLHNRAAQHGCTAGLHSTAEQHGCTSRLHSTAARAALLPVSNRLCIALHSRQHGQAACPGCTAREHRQAHSSQPCICSTRTNGSH